jgi:hypothetical protein
LIKHHTKALRGGRFLPDDPMLYREENGQLKDEDEMEKRIED